jgi:23S rRNA (pseudouridine1915-N3)-methyltransferase
MIKFRANNSLLNNILNMKICIINLGVTQESYLKEGIAIFEKRIRHYASFEMIYLNEPRNMKNQPESVQKENEGKLLLSALEKVDHPVLLDVAGKQLGSEAFSKYLQLIMNKGARNLGFVIGGPYGFSDEVYHAVHERISLSAMTFSHQLVRLIFVEQLYRAFTIIRGEPYHHE